jgi:hypothetical protein
VKTSFALPRKIGEKDGALLDRLVHGRGKPAMCVLKSDAFRKAKKKKILI